MKNKIFSTIITFLFLTVNAGLCDQARNTGISTAITKFALAMGGVVLSSVIIYIGLTLYNKFFVQVRRHSIEDEILRTPKSTEEAVRFFIQKNKLR